MLGLLFGSFDPIHNGHMQIARWALAQGCDEVWFMLQSENAYKSGPPFATLDQRTILVGLAAASSPKLKAVQVGAGNPKHVVLDTLIDLADKEPRLILGSDLAESINSWPDFEKISELANILTHPRFDTPSSSVIRSRIASGDGIEDTMPSDVAEYIALNGLYRP